MVSVIDRLGKLNIKESEVVVMMLTAMQLTENLAVNSANRQELRVLIRMNCKKVIQNTCYTRTVQKVNSYLKKY